MTKFSCYDMRKSQILDILFHKSSSFDKSGTHGGVLMKILHYSKYYSVYSTRTTCTYTGHDIVMGNKVLIFFIL